MDREEKRRRLIVQAAGLVSAMYAFLYTRIILAQRSSRPAITYAPMSAMDEERQRNQDKIGAGAAAVATAAAAAVAKTGGGGAAATRAAGGSGVGNKRKRSMFSEEDVIVITGMNSGLKDVADAIRETKVLDSHPDLYDAVMFMPGFSDEALMAAYSHLLDNKAQGSGFVKMNDSHRALWLRTWLAKHYYI